MSITTRIRRGFATAVAAALAASGVVALAAAPAQAAEKDVSGISLTWSLSDEQGGGAFFGGCNFLSAGKAGNTGSSRLWTQADGFYKTVDGNVSIEKPNAAGDHVAPTWSTKCQDKNGKAVTAGNTGSKTDTRVKLSGGTGSIDPATGAGTISWTGSFTSVFYGGMTYWSATDPVLAIAADGSGTLTATAGGYGADMDNPDLWTPLKERPVTLAEFDGANFSDTGSLTATPTYLGTAVEVRAGTPQPAKTPANEAYWGSFPQSFVDFQLETGQSSYWYTSGGARDAAKPATPVTVQATTPSVTVGDTTFQPDGTQSVTVTGIGFDPSAAIGTRPPFANAPAGAYIAFGRYADNWRPSQPGSGGRHNPAGDNGNGVAVKWAVPAASFPGGPPAQDPASPSYTELKPDGSFSTEIQVNQSWLADKPGNFGIYTYAGGGAVVASFETFTPIIFTGTVSTPTISATAGKHGVTGSTTVTVGSNGSEKPTGDVTLTGAGTAQTKPVGANGTVTFALSKTLPAKKYSLKASYAGDDNTASSTSAAVTYTVAKGKVSSAKISNTTKPTTKKAGATRVTVKSAGGRVTGKVRVILSKGGTRYNSSTVKVSSTGTARVKLPRLNRSGTWNYIVRHYGDSNHVRSDSAKKTMKIARK